MSEKPWWVRVCEIVIMMCSIAIVMMAIVYANRGGGRLELGINPMTVGIALIIFFAIRNVVRAVRRMRGGDGVFWTLLYCLRAIR